MLPHPPSSMFFILCKFIELVDWRAKHIINNGTVCGICGKLTCPRMHVKHSQAIHDQEATLRNLEGRFTEMEEWMKRITLEMENLQKANEALKRRSEGSREDATPSQNEHAESRNARGVNDDEGKRRTMHHELRSLIDKYEEITQRIGALSLVDQLLNSNGLPYSAEVMAAPLSPKFKAPQMER